MALEYVTTGALDVRLMEIVRRDCGRESSVADSKAYCLLGLRDQSEVEEMLALMDMGTPCEICAGQAVFLSGGQAFCGDLCESVFYDHISRSDWPDFDEGWEGF